MSLPELCVNFTSDTCSVVNRTQAFNGRFRSVEFKPSQRCITMDQIITECRPGLDAAFEEIVRKRLKAKVNFGVQILFHKINFIDGTVEKEDSHYMSLRAMVVNAGVIDSFIKVALEKLDEKIEAYTNKGSNSVVAAITQLSLRFVAFK